MLECRMKDDSPHCAWRIYDLVEILKTPLEFLIKNKTKEVPQEFHPSFLIIHS